MDERTARLTACFRAAFPNLPEARIADASTETVGEWDSVASATLVALIEEAFQIQIDLDAFDELTSFAALRAYLNQHLPRP